ncbi:YdcF family protein [Clostridium chromiireducens]|uniref:YdcF family protein n=1 Tax=Clostridium chromiireducens TaxID=225345 RepID=A0A964RM03_9CLOT|nr:YdcF family protein [Clostridium chromiireducens]MVX64084.1 YdcF family protein [Clostridium chromiireducens]
MENVKIQYCINQISEFLAARDIGRLDINELENKFGINKVDILVLLGNSIPYTIKCAVKAYEDKLCDKILINGGIGHSTEILRNEIRKDDIYKFISVENKAEADIIFEIMTKVYKIDSEKIIVENKSTNCGDNAKKAVELLEELNIEYSSLLLVQDPTMQIRTYASFLKYVNPEKVKLINYAPFIPSIDENFKLRNVDINGIWDEQRYLQLIMGEIPRLKDDENGYGPKGKNFIAHVDIPSEIEENYYLLKSMISNEDFYSRC